MEKLSCPSAVRELKYGPLYKRLKRIVTVPTHTHAHTYAHINAHTYKDIYAHTYAHTTHTHTNTSTHTHTNTSTHTHTHTNTSTHTHTNTSTHTHMHLLCLVVVGQLGEQLHCCCVWRAQLPPLATYARHQQLHQWHNLTPW